MSRRLYRSMAQARGMLNRVNRGHASLTAEQMAEVAMQSAEREAELDAYLERERRRHAVPELIEHPVIERIGKPFRVVRLRRRHDRKIDYELIGEALTPEVATEIMKREQWRAQVFNELDRLLADNWRQEKTVSV